jgi:hypothetical protein
MEYIMDEFESLLSQFEDAEATKPVRAEEKSTVLVVEKAVQTYLAMKIAMKEETHRWTSSLPS